MKKHTFSEYGEERIAVYEMDGSSLIEPPIRLGKYHQIMISEGELTIDVNFRVFKMKAESSLHLSAGDMIRMIRMSDNIKGYHIIFSSEFQSEMRTTRNSPINLQLKKEYPYQEFIKTEYEFLDQSVRRLIRYINDTTHLYRAQVVKNEVFNLILNISDKRRKEHGDIQLNSHHEIITERFKDLINGHCDKHHEVGWYADALGITPDYLTKITKNSNGRPASAWIIESLIRKAEFMLKMPEIPIKEISEKLNFPDQSGFGRFFKANTGMSPKEYRKKALGEKD